MRTYNICCGKLDPAARTHWARPSGPDPKADGLLERPGEAFCPAKFIKLRLEGLAYGPDPALGAIAPVIDARSDLIAWYERRGYRPTGETRPFPIDPPRPDLDFVVLEKGL